MICGLPSYRRRLYEEHERSQANGNYASRPLCPTQHLTAQLVLRSVTAWES